jgi:hypothetical protein
VALEPVVEAGLRVQVINTVPVRQSAIMMDNGLAIRMND